MAEKKFFVDINLQGSALTNAKIGTNSGIGSTEGAFGYDSSAHRLQYFDGTATKEVANLSDIAAVTGGLIFQGGYDPTTDTPDITDGTAYKGFFWAATAAGTFLGESVQVGDSIVAKVDNAGANVADWLILQGNIVIATDSVDGISRLATQTEANDGTEAGAVVITPATLQGKIDAQITPEINDKLSKQGGTMSGNINMGTNDITNVGNIGSVASPASRVDGQTITASNGTFTNTLGSFDGSSNIYLDNGLDAGNTHSIVNLPTPTNGGDAANKTYVDGVGATAEQNAKDYADSLAPNYDAAGSASQALTDANAYSDSLAENYDPAGSAATAQENAQNNANSYTDSAISLQSYRTELEAGAWTLVGDTYEATITHNITNTGYPVVTFTDADSRTCEAIYEAISGTEIKVYVNVVPTSLGVSLSAAAPRL